MSICFALIILDSSNNFNLFFLNFKKSQKKIPNNKTQFHCIHTSLCRNTKIFDETFADGFFFCIFFIQWKV